ncbi:MAG: SpoIID/LytB domain-containing protein [Defluviitaleaceae bacterium]|nr:SpoIID/LytB domain-containing protein [Defluviitaleaceae bacterium]
MTKLPIKPLPTLLPLTLALSLLLSLLLPTTVLAYSHMARVGLISSFADRESIAIANTSIWVGYGVAEGFMPVQELHSVGGFTARASGGSVAIFSGGQAVYSFSDGAAQIMASDGDFVFLGGEKYRAIIEFIPSGGRISAVNVISIEEYLFGVLPAEMAPHFELEALKAQAVAARTYTFRQVRFGASHREQAFDICDTTCCQVYKGAANEADRTNEAVFLTYELMLLYDGEPIIANYFSSSGGATENSEDVWTDTLPYLRSVREIAEHNPRVWERHVTWSQLTSAAAAANAGIGAVSGISISRIGASGRVLQLTLHGASGTWVVPPSVGVRGLFTNAGGALPSRNFQIAGAHHTTPTVTVTDGFQTYEAPFNSLEVMDASGAVSTLQHASILGDTLRQIESVPSVARGGNGITINGRGWGHGVGMSQMGAEGMARAGFDYVQILTHYYTGVEIDWYD